MKWKEVFTSSIGKKIIMSLSGIFLILFLIVHVGLNACIWAMDGGVMFNKAAHFMGANVIPRVLEIGLFATFILHIIQGYYLSYDNLQKRKKGYAVQLGNRGSKWYSRSMGILGSLLLIFLVVHISHFWIPSRITGLEEMIIDGKPYHNLYGEMMAVFTSPSSPFIIILYTIGCISLSYHLLHGFQSAFRTLGLSNKKYVKMVQFLGTGFSIVVPLIFILMPISFHFGWLN